jgi:uncharacterized membrane protein HdeD (DUF308 family)
VFRAGHGDPLRHRICCVETPASVLKFRPRAEPSASQAEQAARLRIFPLTGYFTEGFQMSSNDHPDDMERTSQDAQTPAAAYDAGRSAGANQWVLYAVGIVSILGGVIAITMPLLGTLTAALAAGAALIASGLMGLFTAFRRHEGWHVAAAFALALLSIAVGAMILLQPFAGIVALTSLVIAWFAASGLLRIWYGARSLRGGGGWMLALGVLSVSVALMLWFGLPFSATWILGVLLGVDLTIWGALMIALATRIARAEPASDAA